MQIVRFTQTAIPHKQQCEAHVWCSSGEREWERESEKESLIDHVGYGSLRELSKIAA